MSYGLGNIQFNAQSNQAAPPGGNANNGVSIDVNSGNIVLGNDSGDPLAPGQLISSREIIGNLNDFYWNNFNYWYQQTQTTEIEVRYGNSGGQGIYTVHGAITDHRNITLEMGRGYVNYDLYFDGGYTKNLFNLTDSGDLDLPAGRIRTAKPIGGVSAAAKMNFGSKVAAAVIFDAANYLEISLDGVLYKLALAN